MKKTPIVVSLLCASGCAIVLVASIILASIAGIFVLYSVNTENIPKISITSLSNDYIAPFTLLNITGSGFDPNGAISVEFSGGTTPVTVPVAYADENNVRVSVPPFIGGGTGFSSGQVNLRVIQVTDGWVKSSNKMEGLTIGPMSEMGADVKTGIYTRLLINVSIECLERIDTDKTDLVLKCISSLEDLRNQIDLLISGEMDRIILQTVDGSTVSVFQSDLAQLEILLLNMVHELVSAFPQHGTRADPVSGDELPEAWREDYRQYSEIPMMQHQIGSQLLPEAGKFCYGLFTTVTGLVGTAALTIGLGAQIALAVGSSWLTQLASGEIPTPSGTLRTAMETIADDKIGVPIIGLIKDPLNLLSKMNEGLEQAKRFREGEPRGGALLQRNDPAGETIYKSAPGEPVKKLLIPQDRTSMRLEDSFPKVDPGHAVYSGTFEGSATFPRTTACPVDGPVVSHFEYSVILTGTLSANVDESGRMTGTIEFEGDWSATGTPGCPHISCVPSGGAISMSQPVSGRTSSFSGSGSDMVRGVSGSMDNDEVTGFLTFQTTDGSFSVPYELTAE